MTRLTIESILIQRGRAGGRAAGRAAVNADGQVKGVKLVAYVMTSANVKHRKLAITVDAAAIRRRFMSSQCRPNDTTRNLL